MSDHHIIRRHAVRAVAALTLMGALGGCARDNEIDVSQGVGITATRSLCPAAAVPLHSGDLTLFDPPADRTAAAVDVVAALTNLAPACNETGDKIYLEAGFDVIASRRDAGPARSVDLPYFATVVQGGTAVVAKRVGTVRVNFAAGQTRGTGQGKAAAFVDRTAATLPADVRERLTRRRRAGDEDAAVDPLTDPAVRAAVARANFELLVGFQLTEAQLEYNVRR